jgi:hypothetical protein
VLPGWCALELADLFFEATAGLRWPADAAAEDSDKRLTHACGLVLCHLQAPISGISQLARRLAERGKKVRHNADSLNWMLLENFDQAGGDLDGFLATRYPGSGLGWPDLTLTPAALATLRRNLPDLKPLLPRSALLRAARLMVERVLPGDPAPPPVAAQLAAGARRGGRCRRPAALAGLLARGAPGGPRLARAAARAGRQRALDRPDPAP